MNEQIIELESRGHGPSGCTCNPKTGCFRDKTKIFKENKSWNELLRTVTLLNSRTLQKAMYLAYFHLDQVNNYKIYPKNARF